MKALLEEISKCQTCDNFLEHVVRPVLAAHPNSKVIIIGQAPGIKVHNSGIPWEDKSGDNLRDWLGVDKETFYNPETIAIVPMGFCYPGKGKSGDLPPRPECAPQWHPRILKALSNIQFTILIGKYAQDYYLKQGKKKTLTETVKNYTAYMPHTFVLPHPSPRNNIWMAKNPWFKAEVLPELKKAMASIIE